MADRNWFTSGGAAYARHRPDYPPELASFLAQAAPDRSCVVDVGCGSGQFTRQLAQHFDDAIGIDPSQNQIDHAVQADRLRYACAPAETTGLPDGIASLITAAQAAHWFDLPLFYAEARRIAAPGAVLALVSYGVPVFDPQVDARFQHFYRDEIGPYWPPERRLVESGYADIDFPFVELPWPAMTIERNWTLADFLGYLSTWSATRKVEQAGEEAMIDAFVADFAALWGDPDTRRIIRWPVAIRLGQL